MKNVEHLTLAEGMETMRGGSRLRVNDSAADKVIAKTNLGRRVVVGSYPDSLYTNKIDRAFSSKGMVTSEELFISLNVDMLHERAEAVTQREYQRKGAHMGQVIYNNAFASEASQEVALHIKNVSREGMKDDIVTPIKNDLEFLAYLTVFGVGVEIADQSMTDKVHNAYEVVKALAALPLLSVGINRMVSMRADIEEAMTVYSRREMMGEFIPNPHLITLIQGEIALLKYGKKMIQPA